MQTFFGKLRSFFAYLEFIMNMRLSQEVKHEHNTPQKGGNQYSKLQALLTEKELAWEFEVCVRTIMNDIREVSFEYTIYTKTGKYGGVFLTEHYKLCQHALS